MAADFVCVLYNPRSRGRQGQLAAALDLARNYREPHCPVGVVRQAFRPGQSAAVLRLDTVDPEQVDMLSLCIIGNATSRALGPVHAHPARLRAQKAALAGRQTADAGAHKAGRGRTPEAEIRLQTGHSPHLCVRLRRPFGVG